MFKLLLILILGGVCADGLASGSQPAMLIQDTTAPLDAAD